MLKRVIPVAIAAAAAGCANHVSGEVDGQRVEVVDAFFVQGEDVYSSSGDGLLTVVVSGVEDSCEVYTSLEEDMEQFNNAEDRARIWEAHFPEDFWQIALQIRVSDPDDEKEVRKGEYVGVDWYDELEEDEEVSGEVRHFEEHLTPAYFEGGTERGVESYWTDEGELSVDAFRSEEKLSGRFDTEVVDDDGDDEGEVTIHFQARHCDELQSRWYEPSGRSGGGGYGGEGGGGGSEGGGSEGGGDTPKGT